MTLHPLAWLAVVLTLVSVAFTATNWMLLGVVVLALVALNLATGSRTLLGFAALAGLAVVALQVAYACVLGGGADRGVLFTLPAWTLGPGVRLGGAVDAATLATGLAAGLRGAAALLGLALLGGVRAAADWLDATRLLVGPPARHAGPLLALGEAIGLVRRDAARLRAEGLRGLGAAAAARAVGRRAMSLSDAWEAENAGRPSAWAAPVLTLAALGVTWLFQHGSVFVGPLELTPGLLVTLLAAVWLGVRLRTVGLPVRLRGFDGLVLAACAAGMAIAHYARQTAEARTLAATSALPGLPPVTTLVVVALTVVVGAGLLAGRRATVEVRHA